MLATKLIWFYLCLVAFSQVISSTRVNKTSSDGKVFISGDHNEVFLTGTVREIKIALAEIKGVLKSVKKKDEELSKKIQALEKQMFSVNKSNVGLFAQVEVISQRVAALEGQGDHLIYLPTLLGEVFYLRKPRKTIHVIQPEIEDNWPHL